MVATQDMADGNVNRALAVNKVDAKKVDSHFLLLYLLSPTAIATFEGKSLGSAQLRINLTDLREFVVPMPSMKEQREIVRRVEALFAFIDRLEARLLTGC